MYREQGFNSAIQGEKFRTFGGGLGRYGRGDMEK